MPLTIAKTGGAIMIRRILQETVQKPEQEIDEIVVEKICGV